MTKRKYSIPTFEDMANMKVADLDDHLDPSRVYDVVFHFVDPLGEEDFKPKWSEKGEGFLCSYEVKWCIQSGARLGRQMLMELKDVEITDEGPASNSA